MQIDVGAADADHFISAGAVPIASRVSDPLVIAGPESDLSW